MIGLDIKKMLNEMYQLGYKHGCEETELKVKLERAKEKTRELEKGVPYENF